MQDLHLFYPVFSGFSSILFLYRVKKTTSMETIDLWKAIEEMKQISDRGETFSFKFRKHNRKSGTGGDLVSVGKARLRAKTSDEEIANSSYKLFYTDTETGQAANCWQILIMEFNGMKTIV